MVSAKLSIKNEMSAIAPKGGIGQRNTALRLFAQVAKGGNTARGGGGLARLAERVTMEMKMVNHHARFVQLEDTNPQKGLPGVFLV